MSKEIKDIPQDFKIWYIAESRKQPQSETFKEWKRLGQQLCYEVAHTEGYQEAAEAAYRHLSGKPSPDLRFRLEERIKALQQLEADAGWGTSHIKISYGAGVFYLQQVLEWLDESIPSSEPAKESQPIGNGISMIAMERREQIEKHGRTVEKDIESNGRYQITHAARMLAWAPDEEGFDLMRDDPFIPEGWSKEIWHKMMDKSYRERLVIAGALIAAELDRLTYDGQSSPQHEPSEENQPTEIPHEMLHWIYEEWVKDGCRGVFPVWRDSAIATYRHMSLSVPPHTEQSLGFLQWLDGEIKMHLKKTQPNMVYKLQSVREKYLSLHAQPNPEPSVASIRKDANKVMGQIRKRADLEYQKSMNNNPHGMGVAEGIDWCMRMMDTVPFLFRDKEGFSVPGTNFSPEPSEDRKETISKLEQIFKDKAEFLDDWIDHAALAYDFFHGLVSSPPSEEEDGWNDADKGVPKHNDLVLGWHREMATYCLCFYNYGQWNLSSNLHYASEREAKVLTCPGKITHWRELPKKVNQ